MKLKVLFPAVAFLSLLMLFGLAGSTFLSLSPVSPAYAQSAAPTFPQVDDDNEEVDYTREVAENAAPYTEIGNPVTATGTITYSLKNARTSHFGINPATGQLLVGVSPNYEEKASYNVTVIATDSSGRTDEQNVDINVNNLDEGGKVILSWKQPQVATELEATLTDPDGNFSDITWTWEGSQNRSNWTSPGGAPGTNGASSTYTPVSVDVGKYLRATVSYTDGEGSSKTAQRVSYREVRDSPGSNSAPELDEDFYQWFVSRSAPIGTEIYNPSYATDADGDELRYSLEGTDADKFDILPGNGYLVTKKLLSRVDSGPPTR